LVVRQEIVDQLKTHLDALPSFSAVLLWDDVPTEYSQNAIYIKDVAEKYEKKNLVYIAILRIEIVAVVLETSQDTAAKLGNIALVDLIEAVSKLSLKGVIFNLVDSHKWIETSGKTACQVELNLDVKYQF
jgi:hypothetical protein